ncbi:hypothetical protein DFH27DRAFT_569468 [Peziza echinospora]|nr:hypothetical protein DFH27DRAFT_569468 [Peziza echinospora]
MHFPTTLIALLVASPALLANAQRLQKNVIGGPHTDRFLSEIWDTMKPPKSTNVQINGGKYPAACKAEAERTGCNVKDTKVYDVTYADCPGQPWTVCRCGNPPTSLDAQIDLFARLPVKARVHVRHLMNFPGWKGKTGVAAYAVGPDFALVSDVGKNFAIMVHEVAHVLDKEKSKSKEFQDAFNKDSCVLSDYALTGMAENFAVIAPLIMIEAMNPAGWPKIKADLKMDCMKNQYEYVRNAFFEMFKPGGTCPPRVEKNSPFVRRSMRVREAVEFEPIVEEHHNGPFLSKRELEMFARNAEPVSSPDNEEAYELYDAEGEEDYEDGGSSQEGETEWSMVA